MSGEEEEEKQDIGVEKDVEEEEDDEAEGGQGQRSSSSHHQSSFNGSGGSSEIGNPRYCTYIDGVYTYKDPRSSGNEFIWEEGSGSGSWRPKIFLGNPVTFDGRDYTYVDPGDGTVFAWDPTKSAWFPKSQGADCSTRTKGSTTTTQKLKVSGIIESSESTGFINPNYDNSLQGSHPSLLSHSQQPSNSQSQVPRRFYYAALSPSEMGVNEPVLFLSPDDQVNNNSTAPPPLEEEGSMGVHPQLEDSSSKHHKGPIPPQGLPPGWERHEDASGAYYWHIKSGTIQRELPSSEQPLIPGSNPALLIPGTLNSSSLMGPPSSFRRSQTVSSQLSTSASNSSIAAAFGGFGLGSSAVPTSTVDSREKRKSWSQFLENNEKDGEKGGEGRFLRDKDRPKSESSLRFVAVSLGSLCISEEDLTPERSSRAVSKVIAELTNPGHGVGLKGVSPSGLEVAGKIWGEGSELYLELDDSHLRIKTNKEKSLVVAEQPIHSIRVWGVGRDDPRDFAYVAREKVTRQLLCHVFRLDINARPLASALRDACKKIMIERQQKQKRPTTLPTGLRKNVPPVNPATSFFPTPMDEPRKILRAHFLGTKVVSKPNGMDILNGAIDAMKTNEPIPVSVSVAPSVIMITSDEQESPKILIEIRVRYLSFMGIGRDVQTCGVIVHTARDDFQAYCFFSTPSSGALCKAIEAACVLRYQKCLDSHHYSQSQQSHGVQSSGGTGGTSSNEASSSSSSVTPSQRAAATLASAFKTVLASFGRSRSVEEKL